LYQKDAVDSIYSYLKRSTLNPVAVLPPGAGKSWTIAAVCRDTVQKWNGRIIMAVHSRDLIKQNYDKLLRLAPDLALEAGIYSAGLKSRDTSHKILMVGIQSVFDKADLIGPADLIIVDEVHRCNSEDGSYKTFLEAMKRLNPLVRLIGFTATPWRLGGGPICNKDNLFNEVCYEIGVKELIRDGWLCPITTKCGYEEADLKEIHIRNGEFAQDELEAMMNEDRRVAMTCLEIMERTVLRNSVLVFCSGIKHAEKVAALLMQEEQTAACVFGDTPYDERDKTLDAFRAGKIKYLVSVDVLGMGFDAPATDAIAMLRPTTSPGLMTQQAGRGFRISEGKKNLLLMDFSGNIQRLGMIDSVVPPGKKGHGEAVVKMCPECREIISGGYSKCPECEFEFPNTRGDAKHGTTPYDGSVISGPPELFRVDSIAYWEHRKKDAPEGHPPTLRVQYECEGGLVKASEFVCLEHTGFARQKACGWWMTRMASRPPGTVKAALEEIDRDGIKEPNEILIGYDGKYAKIFKVMGLEHRAPEVKTSEPVASAWDAIPTKEEEEEDLFR
jgi:DNA repair protein RadD